MYIEIILKTIFIYFFIVLVYRIMGKKEVGELGVIDLIVSVLIAEFGVLCIDNTKTILNSVIPIIVITFIQVVLSLITLKSSNIRNILEGKPVVIINKGKINFKEMAKLRYTLDDLVSQLREEGIKSIEEVGYAVLENNGKLSVFKEKTNYPLPLILDGIIDFKVLNEIDKDEMWIYKLLKDRNIKLEDVFYAFYKDDETYIIKKVNCK